ncbi:amino acid permease [Sutcliffiella cohnii]|uniref:amino acid permease n=1 Tax=Sutcliffiella cohnii TaxID=33932 RepID=UPI000AB145D6|nr:amino acid permease [Sutcliffiella cohnii]
MVDKQNMSSVFQKYSSQSGGSGGGENKEGISWWHLSLIGVGCTIGIGYFLGSGLGIKSTGPSIVISFLIAALGTYIVYNLLAKMTAEDPQDGSFCYYANKAYGRWAGFSCGWNFWSANILIIGSQLTALGLLSKFWFPHVPLWIFAAIYAALSILVVLLGAKGFGKVEDVLAIIKTSAILMFIIIGALVFIGIIDGSAEGRPGVPTSYTEFFPEGLKGFWGSLIFAFYAYGGVEVIGLMAMELKHREDAPKAGKVMLTLLAIIYLISLTLVVTLVSYTKITEKESPFVTALANYDLTFFPHVFNAAIIIAGFSTMTAALFGVTTLLVTMAKSGDAPKLFEKKLKFRELPLASLSLAVVGLLSSVIAALLLPGKIFEYITTAAGILLLYNWMFIIVSALKNLDNKMWDKILAFLGILFIIAAVSGTVVEKTSRFGFYVSFAFVGVIGICTLILSRKWKKEEQST